MNVEYTWTEEAAALINAEAPSGFRFQTAIPAAFGPIQLGDVLAWDWIANGQRFIVAQRLLRWDDYQTSHVELLLDLPSK